MLPTALCGPVLNLCKTSTLKTNYRLMQVKSIAECSKGFIKGYSRKKYLGGGGGGGGVGKEGKQYIFLWVVGADIFQIIWVIGV